MKEKSVRFVREYLLTCLLVFALFAIVTGLAYPFLMTGIGKAAFGNKADGSLVKQNGKTVGSSLIGQQFTDPRYFHGRPSAAGTSGYDATASGASNLGPTNPDLARQVAERAATVRKENGLAPATRVPADLVESSSSGLDPDISPESARLQVARIARARHLPQRTILTLIEKNTSERQLGVLGERRVNVLQLNLALDRASR
jgi:potassium-transporting ATPase KdpC subunit